MVFEGAWEWLHLFKTKNMTPNVKVYYYMYMASTAVNQKFWQPPYL